MQPVPIQPYSIKINSLKIGDINNLMKKHFREQWKHDESL